MILSIFVLAFQLAEAQEKKDYKAYSIGFYNVENLFDIYDSPNTYDEDFTPSGKYRWTAGLYQKKLENLARVISSMGREELASPPAIVGLCEIENLQVLEDLVKMPLLAPYNYQIIHSDSPDERGIDVALLYRANAFKLKDWKNHELLIYEARNTSKRDFTRDQLVVSGSIDGEDIHLIVNHWPSRSGGEKLSSYKRAEAARLNKRIIDSLQKQDPYTGIVNMGDFNDDPANASLNRILGARAKKEQVGFGGLYNPFAAIASEGRGTSAYRDQWNLFDQILVSKSLIEKSPKKFTFFRAYIFNPPFLITSKGAYKNYPFRSFGQSGFTGGFSDHFPVYIILTKQLN
ncbi:endonuclease/exonuclease/phosphatase family protein [Salinimicrobium tongyeongense]|uniref:Endonuclease/exonuclease/phosphatase family protein n=1 Tax=Salinimicrobium tongyeongense TaxID=2809707 RepID=A0ABY6NV63_9FLAO|nr:endonuclease/exonuclease/phosphatase family protein [Salinimicrobium tongyeongense]